MKTKIKSMFESAYNFINCEEECYYIKSEILDYLCGKIDFPDKYEFYMFKFTGGYKRDNKDNLYDGFKVIVTLTENGTNWTSKYPLNELIGESELDFYIKEVRAKMEENMSKITNKEKE